MSLMQQEASLMCGLSVSNCNRHSNMYLMKMHFKMSSAKRCRVNFAAADTGQHSNYWTKLLYKWPFVWRRYTSFLWVLCPNDNCYRNLILNMVQLDCLFNRLFALGTKKALDHDWPGLVRRNFDLHPPVIHGWHSHKCRFLIENLRPLICLFKRFSE